jgi:hypothetical protein
VHKSFVIMGLDQLRLVSTSKTEFDLADGDFSRKMRDDVPANWCRDGERSR